MQGHSGKGWAADTNSNMDRPPFFLTAHQGAKNKVVKKHDCSKCKFRGTLPGDAHIKCNLLDELAPNETFFLLRALSGNIPKGVVINPFGRKNRWAVWPLNFDPAWIEECKYYEE